MNVEEFLFGGVTEETEDDAPAEVGGELPAGDAHATDEADDAGDLETDGEPDGDSETNEEPDTDDDAGEQPAPVEAETPDELKVVLSIRGNRATIGVQRPAADPHIESFDDPELFGLADEFPAVVARARARWEEEPLHPTYVKPAAPPRQRNRRQQGAAPATTTEEGADGEQPQPAQPETLRLF